MLLCRLACAQQPDSLALAGLSPEDSVRVKVKRLDINSDRSDFSPVMLNNTLLFVSGRPSMVGVKYSDAQNKDLTDLYYATRRDSLNFAKAQGFSAAINSIYNEGPFTVSADGNTLYFSGNARTRSRSKTPAGQLQIYSSVKTEGKWTAPQTAFFSQPGHSSCHPAFSKGNGMIVFCSDMPGGYGGTDLYYIELKGGVWTQPVNFGPAVNSADNELFPFMAGDSTLYFSSSRAGYGGLDLYVFRMGQKGEIKAEALDAPFNTTSDDFGIWLNEDGRSGYFSSNRPGSTGDDIYFFYTAHPDFSKAITPAVKTSFCYTFFEENGYESTDSVSMSYEWDFGGGNKVRGEKCRYCFSKPGNYPVQLNVVETSSGEVFHNKVTYTLTVEEPPRLMIEVPDSAAAGAELVFDATRSRLKGYQLLDYYWSFGDGRYNNGTYARHKFLRKGDYTVTLGVTARNEVSQKTEQFKIEKRISIHEP